MVGTGEQQNEPRAKTAGNGSQLHGPQRAHATGIAEGRNSSDLSGLGDPCLKLKKAHEERVDAKNEEQAAGIRQKHWKSKIVRNNQMKNKPGDLEDNSHGKNFEGRSRKRQNKRQRPLDLMGLEEINTTDFHATFKFTRYQQENHTKGT